MTLFFFFFFFFFFGGRAIFSRLTPSLRGSATEDIVQESNIYFLYTRCLIVFAKGDIVLLIM